MTGGDCPSELGGNGDKYYILPYQQPIIPFCRLYKNLDTQNCKNRTFWWSRGEESACQCRGHGFDPWSGKIPQAAEQQSPCTTPTEAQPKIK